MVDVALVILFLVAVGTSFFAAWTIGAGSSGSTPFAPAVGANAITTMRAAFVVGILSFAGAVLQGAAITETMGEDLIAEVSLSPLAAAIALGIGSIYIAAGVFKGYPIATAFAITGSIVGVGLAMGGQPAWGTYTEIGLYWLLTPVAVAPPTYVLTKALRGDRISERLVVAMLSVAVGLVIANMTFLILGPPGEQGSFASILGEVIPGPWFVGQGLASIFIAGVIVLAVDRDLRDNPERAQRRFLLGLGALVAFTAGGGKVGLAVGPLLPFFEGVVGTVPITWILLFGGLGMIAGTWMAAPRMIKALSQDYAALGPRRSIALLVPTFIIAQIGIALGLPMSFNQIFIFAIAATGYAVGAKTVSESKLFWTVVAWIGSLLFGLIVGYAVYWAAAAVTGMT